MPRLLMVGLDAAERTLVRRWAAEGHLPNLARLAERSGMYDLASPALQFPDQVWPSIYLSRSAANLNRYFYIRVQPGEWKLEMVGDDLAGSPFWVEAGRHGRFSVVVDAPKTALSPPFNGRQIACWGSHASHAETASHPPELLDGIIARHGRYPLHSCDAHGNSPREYRLLRDQLLVDAEPLTKTSGQPFSIAELEAAIGKFFDGIPNNEGGEVPANAGQLPEPQSGHDDGSLRQNHRSPQGEEKA